MTLTFEKIISACDSLKLDYDRIDHEPVFTVQGAVFVAGKKYGSGTKSIVLSSESNIVVVSVRDDLRVDINAVQKETGIRKLSFTSPDKIQEMLSVQIGAVAPFGYDGHLLCIISKEVFEMDRICLNPGRNDVTIELGSRSFKKLSEHFKVHVAEVSL